MFGLVDAYSQSVSPAKAGGYLADPMPVKLLVQPAAGSPVSGTFIAPAGGRYQFVLHGSGGLGQASIGGPGSLAIRTVRLAKGQGVPYSVAAINNITAINSTVTFTDRTMIAGAGGFDGGSGSAGGIATGGDINVNGVDNATQAASYGPFIGGIAGYVSGGPVPGRDGQSPGGGGGTATDCTLPGAGRLIVIFLGP